MNGLLNYCYHFKQFSRRFSAALVAQNSKLNLIKNVKLKRGSSFKVLRPFSWKITENWRQGAFGQDALRSIIG